MEPSGELIKTVTFERYNGEEITITFDPEDEWWVIEWRGETHREPFLDTATDYVLAILSTT